LTCDAGEQGLRPTQVSKEIGIKHEKQYW